MRVCTVSAGLQWTVAWMGGWFYWSTSAPLRATKSAEQPDLGVAVETIFPGQTRCAVPFWTTSSLVGLTFKFPLFVQDAYGVILDSLSLEIPTQRTHVWSFKA